MLHTLIGFAMSVSARRPPQHRGKEDADELHFAFACPLPLHGVMLLSEMCLSGLLVSALTVGISPLEEWQSRLFVPRNTFPSLQLCPCSGHPASGN